MRIARLLGALRALPSPFILVCFLENVASDSDFDTVTTAIIVALISMTTSPGSMQTIFGHVCDYIHHQKDMPPDTYLFHFICNYSIVASMCIGHMLQMLDWDARTHKTLLFLPRLSDSL